MTSGPIIITLYLPIFCCRPGLHIDSAAYSHWWMREKQQVPVVVFVRLSVCLSVSVGVSGDIDQVKTQCVESCCLPHPPLFPDTRTHTHTHTFTLTDRRTLLGGPVLYGHDKYGHYHSQQPVCQVSAELAPLFFQLTKTKTVVNEIYGALQMQDVKIHDFKMTDEIAGRENVVKARREIAGSENT